MSAGCGQTELRVFPAEVQQGLNVGAIEPVEHVASLTAVARHSVHDRRTPLVAFEQHQRWTAPQLPCRCAADGTVHANLDRMHVQEGRCCHDACGQARRDAHRGRGMPPTDVPEVDRWESEAFAVSPVGQEPVTGPERRSVADTATCRSCRGDER